MLRFYVFLGQYLDRCLDEELRKAHPEFNLEAHLKTTRADLRAIVSPNPVVTGKVQQEGDRILALGESCLKGQGGGTARSSVQTEREVLRHKAMALSDLLAVFRARAATPVPRRNRRAKGKRKAKAKRK